MNTLVNDNNGVIFEKIKEFNKYFTKFILPLLKYWIDVLLKGIKWNEQTLNFLEGGSSENITTTTTTISTRNREEVRVPVANQIESNKELFREKLMNVEDLLVKVNDIIDGRCSVLLSEK